MQQGERKKGTVPLFSFSLHGTRVNDFALLRPIRAGCPGDIVNHFVEAAQYLNDTACYHGYTTKYLGDIAIYPNNIAKYPGDMAIYPSATRKYPGATTKYPGAVKKYLSATAKYLRPEAKYLRAEGIYLSPEAKYPEPEGIYLNRRRSITARKQNTSDRKRILKIGQPIPLSS